MAVPDIVNPDNEDPYDFGNIEGKTYTVKFIITDLDYALNRGNSRVTSHHAVIVPETPVFNTSLSRTNSGYAGSYMNMFIMPAFAQGLAGAFGAPHIAKFNADGQSCTCRLMTMSMVFGQTLPEDYAIIVRKLLVDYSNDSCLGGVQFAAFSLHHDLQRKGMAYMVSDLCYDYLSVIRVFMRLPSFHKFVSISDPNVRFTSDSGSGVRPFALLI